MPFTREVQSHKRRILAAAPILAAAVGVAAWAAISARGQAPTDSSPAAKIEQALAAAPAGVVPATAATGETREFTLEVHQIQHELAPGVKVTAWAFGFPGQQPTVPGPVLRVKEGDLVRVTLKNTHDQPHTIHLHGITSVSQEMDGVPHTSKMIMPGESYTYEFVASTPGTHIYHCHVNTDLHMDMGMYGALVVEPKEALVKADAEQVLILDEWDSRQDPNAPKHVSNPNYFLINGKSFPSAAPFTLAEGKIGLLRVVNAGYEAHSMHLHGNEFLMIAKNGRPLPEPMWADTLAISPGERFDIVIKGRTGTFPLHDHYVQNVTNAGVYPGGMHMLIQGTPEQGSPHANSGPAHTNSDTATAESKASAPQRVPAATGNVPVDIKAFKFVQPGLRVKVGTTVTWLNRDTVAHTVTEGVPMGDQKRLFDSDLVAPGKAFSYTFSKPGQYDYFCLPHPFMTGKIIVEP